MEDNQAINIRMTALQHALQDSIGQSSDTILEKAKAFEKFLIGVKKRGPRKAKKPATDPVPTLDE